MAIEQRTQPTILLSAGGSGGHVFPARALAEELLREGYHVELATDIRGIRYFKGLDEVKTHIISSGAYTSGLKGKIFGLLSLLKGYVQSHGLISKIKPVAVVGFGGYPSAPPLFAAQHRGIPTILHEQNAILGLANKLLANGATKIALSSEHTSNLKPEWARKSVTTGNPVRGDIVELKDTPYPDLQTGKIHLMIFAGSQGAKSFANVIPKAIVSLPENIRNNLIVCHQARPDDLEHVKELYKGTGIETDIRPFFDDMADFIAKSHLLITRSGASTTAELTTAGRPAIYIPFPRHQDNQQVHNAKEVVSVGGAIMIEEKDLTIERLRDELEHLLTTPAHLEDMARKSALLGKPDAAKRLMYAVLDEIR